MFLEAMLRWFNFATFILSKEVSHHIQVAGVTGPVEQVLGSVCLVQPAPPGPQCQGFLSVSAAERTPCWAWAWLSRPTWA